MFAGCAVVCPPSDDLFGCDVDVGECKCVCDFFCGALVLECFVGAPRLEFFHGAYFTARECDGGLVWAGVDVVALVSA